MSWYRRSKLALQAFRSNFSSKISPKPSPPRQPAGYSNPISPAPLSSRAYWSPPFSRKILKFEACPFTASISRRCYYVDKQVRHFKSRWFSGWVRNPIVFVMVVVGAGFVGAGFVLTIYFGSSETIAYTRRNHSVILSKSIGRQLGESQFEQMKTIFKGKMLPAIHPDSVRVRLIATDIVQALQRGLRMEHLWTDLGYASEHMGRDGGRGHETLEALSASPEGSGCGKEDEILDDKWIQQSRRKGREKGAHSASSHLEGVKWEILVVDEPVVNAFCLQGGKIVVFTGLLKHLKTDAEIATVIGHEVAYAALEQMVKTLWFIMVHSVFYLPFVTPDIVNTMSNLLLKLPISRRMELEASNRMELEASNRMELGADSIGLLLMAYAGYDPRVAPRVYEKLGQVAGDSTLRDYLSTHPSGKKRAKLLAEAKVMEEALTIYRELELCKKIQKTERTKPN